MNKDLLELYSDYLISAFSHTTATTGLSAMTGGTVSHDKITRFLAKEELGSVDLWRLLKPMVRQLDGQEEEREEPSVLIIDDTIEEKPYTELESELLCWHYEHSQGRTVKGINLISLLYQVGDASVPVGPSSWSRKPSGSLTRIREGGKGRAPRAKTSIIAGCSRLA